MELILFVCLVSTPATCREEFVSVSLEPIPATRCMGGAQPMIAEWTAAHPRWRVARWRCGVPGAQGRQI